MSWSLGQLSGVISNHDNKINSILKWINEFVENTRNIGIDVLKSVSHDPGIISIASTRKINELIQKLPNNEAGNLVKDELAQDYGTLQAPKFTTQMLSYPLNVVVSIPIENLIYNSTDDSFDAWNDDVLDSTSNRSKMLFNDETFTLKFSKLEVLDAYYKDYFQNSVIHLDPSCLKLNSGNVRGLICYYDSENKQFQHSYDVLATSYEGQFKFSQDEFEVKYKNSERIYPSFNDGNSKGDEEEDENVETKTETHPCISGVINYFNSIDTILLNDPRGILMELQIDNAVVLSEGFIENCSGKLLSKLKHYSEIYTTGKAHLYKIDQQFMKDLNRQLAYIDLYSDEPLMQEFIGELNKMLCSLPGFIQHKKIGVNSPYTDYIVPKAGVWTGTLQI